MLTFIRFVHYVAGIAWVGAILVLTLLVFPALDRCVGRVRAPVMRMLGRRVSRWQAIAAVVVILSGGLQAVLGHRLDGGLHVLRSEWGGAIAAGLVCAVLLVVLGVVAIDPLTNQLVKLEEAAAEDPERAGMTAREIEDIDPDWWHIRQQLMLASVIAVVLALAAVLAMAVARGA